MVRLGDMLFIVWDGGDRRLVARVIDPGVDLFWQEYDYASQEDPWKKEYETGLDLDVEQALAVAEFLRYFEACTKYPRVEDTNAS